MSSTYGQRFRFTIFGQSHGPAIGVTIEGLPAGKAIDLRRLQDFLARRAPGGSNLSTSRAEADSMNVLSGLVDGHTCGAPLTAVIENTNLKNQNILVVNSLQTVTSKSIKEGINYLSVMEKNLENIKKALE